MEPLKAPASVQYGPTVFSEASGVLELDSSNLRFTSDDNQHNFEVPVNEISQVMVGTPIVIDTKTGNYAVSLGRATGKKLFGTMVAGGAGAMGAEGEFEEARYHLDDWKKAFQLLGITVKDRSITRMGRLLPLWLLVGVIGITTAWVLLAALVTHFSSH